ncbi:hypothetical protein WJX72_003170 [[Myrmecia] bisecta]|uniref:Uncharacterized protein n=1 Tax=[Myrmecia] bisecta TaxID=41462 RepID=A0AAW1P8A9_9CHLO
MAIYGILAVACVALLSPSVDGRLLRHSGTSPKCQIPLDLWAQCGGQGGMCIGDSCADKEWPSTCCPGACHRQNAFFWQCLTDSPTQDSGTEQGTTPSITPAVLH